MIVQEQPGSKQPSRPLASTHGENQSERTNSMGRHSPKYFALLERLPYQRKFVVFEIAQTAVDQLGGGT